MEIHSVERADIFVVIPAYQAGTRIETVLRRIPDFIKGIIVVNDGSTDDTELIVRRVSREDPLYN